MPYPCAATTTAIGASGLQPYVASRTPRVFVVKPVCGASIDFVTTTKKKLLTGHFPSLQVVHVCLCLTHRRHHGSPRAHTHGISIASSPRPPLRSAHPTWRHRPAPCNRQQASSRDSDRGLPSAVPRECSPSQSDDGKKEDKKSVFGAWFNKAASSSADKAPAVEAESKKQAAAESTDAKQQQPTGPYALMVKVCAIL